MNSSSCKIIAFVMYVYLQLNDVHGDSYNTAQVYNFPTPWPINVDLSSVKHVDTDKPLQFTAGPIERALCLNTGRSAIVELGQARTSDTISGGVLGSDTYIYKFCRFYWVNETDQSARAASTIDGRGQPLEVSLYYWNSKYSNFSNALNYRNGLAVFTLPIAVGPVPNPFFVLFQQYLVRIKKASTQVPALLSFTYLWYVLFLTQFYYAYPGSYRDESTNQTYDCATIILHPQALTPFIENNQFRSFLDLRDDEGKPLTNQAPLYFNRGQPVVRAEKVTVIPYVF